MIRELSTWTNDHWLIVVLTFGIGWLVYEIGQLLIKTIVRHFSRASAKHTKRLRKSDIEKRAKTLSNLFVTIWRIIMVTFVALIIFTTFFPHVSLAPLFASAGIVGVALGFGAQSIVKDFLSGVFIIAENQYRVGDIIEVGGFSGTVERIGIRCTVFRDADGNLHFFPNGQIIHVTNKTMGYGVARMSIDVSTEADLAAVKKIINKVGQTMADDPTWKTKILSIPRFHTLDAFSGNKMTLSIEGKTLPADQWAVAAELRQRLFEEFKKDHIPLGS